MAFTVKGKKDANATTLQHKLDLLGASEGCLTNFVDNADADDLGSRSVRIEYKIRTGTSPVSNAPIMFFLITADDESTQHWDGDRGTNLTFSTTSATELTGSTDPTAARMLFNLNPAIHVRPVDTTTGADYYGSFVIDVTGARYWALYIHNSTGVALNGTSTNHYVRYIADVPDIR